MKYEVDEETEERNKQFYSDINESYTKDEEVYVSVFCPQCNKKNWVYTGRNDRYTSCSDGYACACWSCEHEFWMHNPEMIEEFFGTEFAEYKGDIHKLLDEVTYAEEGRKKAPWEDDDDEVEDNKT